MYESSLLDCLSYLEVYVIVVIAYTVVKVITNYYFILCTCKSISRISVNRSLNS